MPILVAPQVCRFAVNGSYSGHNVVNIIDMQIDTTGTLNDRAEQIFDQAGIIINEWEDSILTCLVSAYSADSVSWLDLNSLTGSVGVRTSTDDTEWPSQGTVSGDGAPGNVALRIDKNTSAQRGQRQGRMYLCGFVEGWTQPDTPNEVDSSNTDIINPRLASFLGDINQDQGGLNPTLSPYTSQMVVTHTAAGTFTSFSGVNSLTVNKFSSSQVRRIRR